MKEFRRYEVTEATTASELLCCYEPCVVRNLDDAAILRNICSMGILGLGVMWLKDCEILCNERLDLLTQDPF